MQGLNYLQKKLEHHRRRGLLRYRYYSSKENNRYPSITISPEYQRMYRSASGWSAKAVNELADRLVVRGLSNDYYSLQEIFDMNNPDVFFDSAITSALIVSCSFVYISKSPDTDIPRLQVIDGTNATGILDPTTNLLTEGYAVLERDKYNEPKVEAYFIPGTTSIYVDGKLSATETTNAPYCALVPIIHRPDADRPFGRSRITRSAMYYQDFAKRTLERSEVTAEFYSWPQKYVTGLDPDAEVEFSAQKATIDSFLAFYSDANGKAPTLGQFSSSGMNQFNDQMKTIASGFAGETGLTLEDMGFPTSNPSSAESIKASHESLRAMGRKAQRNFSSGFINVGYIAACMRDKFPYRRNNFHLTKVRWYPMFELDSQALSGIGDAVYKINTSVPDAIDSETLEDLTGL